MRMMLCVLGVLTIASSAMGAAISFSEDWDSYSGSADANYIATWPHAAGSSSERTGFSTTYKHSGTQSLVINNDWTTPPLPQGYSHQFAGTGGNEWQATDAAPITLEHYGYSNGGKQAKWMDTIVALTLGDVDITTIPLVGAAPLDEPIPVLAFSKPNSGGKTVYYFDGTGWIGVSNNANGVWERYTMVVNGTTVDLDFAGSSTYSGTLARQYTGDFDRVLLASVVNASGGDPQAAELDDVAVSGGVEVVPEPAALALLTLGGLFLRRRR